MPQHAEARATRQESPDLKMDDPEMNHILEATEFPEREARTLDNAETAVRGGGRFPWDRFIRCATLAAIVAAIGWMAWNPAMLRVSQLVFLVSPTTSESLALPPELEDGDQPLRLQARKETARPGEWRPESGAAGEWRVSRPAANNVSPWRGAGILPIRWRRLSGNPWNWRDDSVEHMRRGEQPLPPQKSATTFRVKEEDAWGALTAQAETAQAETPEPEATETAQAEAHDDPNLLELPPLPLENIAEKTPEPPATPASPVPALPAVSPFPTLEPVATAARQETPQIAQTPQTPDAAPESVDWKNREITAPIPGAYLTIYPKLKFIGLCVPGQGYIRKYNQVGVPENPAGGKLAATDGLTPYGQYYIAARSGAGGNPRLELSWPSPEDATRIGLGLPERAAIEAAWREQALPPQDTTAGGGLALTGFSGLPAETTKGGFALETPQMEEIAAALPDGAWVFIQE